MKNDGELNIVNVFLKYKIVDMITRFGVFTLIHKSVLVLNILLKSEKYSEKQF